MNTRLIGLGLATLVAGAPLAPAADWPRYRGVNFDGISTEQAWTTQWPASGPRVLWEKSLGPGGSSLVVSQNRLYTMGNVDNQDIVYCFDAETGKELWRHSYPCPLDTRQFEGGPAATPTVDGDRVFTVSHKGDVFCLDAATGRVIWSKSLAKDFKGARPQWGWAGSPLVDGDALILEPGGHGCSTVALRKTDGTVLWQAGDDMAGYASPVPATLGGQRLYLAMKGKAFVAVRADSGAEVWRLPWRTSWDVNAAVPIVSGDQVFISSGYKRGGALLKAGANNVQIVWENKNMCNMMNSSVLLNGYLYGISGNQGPEATLNCVEWATGALKWAEKGMGCGSLLAADGKLIVLGETGELVVSEASPAGFKALARAQILKERCWVAPILAGGRLYARTNRGKMVALDLRPAR